MIIKLRHLHAGCFLVSVGVLLCAVSGCRPADRRAGEDTDPDASSAALEQIGQVSQPRQIERLVRALSPIDRQQLREKRSRFDALKPQEKDRLREFHRQICRSDSGTELYGVLRRYRDWLATIPDGQRADLLELPAEQRIAKIREIQQSQQASSFRVYAGDIPPEDAMTVAKWLHDYVRQHERELLRQLPGEVRSRLGSTQDGRRKQRMLFFEVARNLKTIQLPNPEPSHLQQLRDSLSAEGSSRLGELVDLDDSALAVRNLLTKLAESMQRKLPSKERLMEFYQRELTTEQRDRIDQLPPEQAQRELRRQFFIQRMRERGDGQRREGGRHEGGRRGPPRRPGEGRRAPMGTG